jgi:hypothetical protein
MSQVPENNPISAYQRRATAARRSAGKKCACGESRPEALIPNSNPTICAACDRKNKGRSLNDDHHLAGKANHTLTVPTPVNDHRAELSVAQYDWPKITRENPDGCPLIAAAGCIRGFVDWVVYTVKHGLLWIAGLLEALSEFLAKVYGPKWWIGTPLERFARSAEA